MFEATLVFLGGSVDLSRWVGALKAFEESAVDYSRIVASSTASPFAVLVASGYTLKEIGELWNGFEISIGRNSISADQIGKWVGGLLEAKGVRKFGDLKKIETPELKLIVQDVDDPTALTLPDDASSLGLEPDQVGIVSALRASMAIPDLPVFAPVRLGGQLLGGYYRLGRESRSNWSWERAIRPQTDPVWLYSEPIVLGGVRTLIKRILFPSYYSLLQLDKAISQSRFTLGAQFASSTVPISWEFSSGDGGIMGFPRGGRFINLRDIPSSLRFKTDDMLEAARMETERGLRALGISSRSAREGWIEGPGTITVGVATVGGTAPGDSETTEVGRPEVGIAAPSPPGAARSPASSGAEPKESPGGEAGPTVPVPPAKVFPKIDVSNEHPVQHSILTITVSLEFQRDPKTTGVVSVPVDDKPHHLDVHLLLGKESQWGQLTFQRPLGTIKPAEFADIRVPVLVPDAQGVVRDHQLCEIYVNFYLEGRWCGEAVRHVEVRPSSQSPSLAVIPTPEAPAWRKDLLVAPGTPPPDLLIRIEQVGNLEFEWHLFSPYMSFSRDVRQMRKSLTDTPYRYVKDHFEIFSGTELMIEQINKLHSNCDLIYEAAPQGFHKAYRDLCAEVAKDASGRKHFNTIQIVSDEAFIPWELMRVSDPSDTPAFEPEILCLKHCVGRWMAKDSNTLRNNLEVHKITVSASDYKTLNVPRVAPLEWAAAERTLLVSKPYEATPVPLQLPALNEFLRGGSAEMIHFSCHGNTDVQVPEEATLKTEDDAVGLEARLVSMPEVRVGVGKHHPVVFLNACQAAAGGQVIGMVFGWPQAFLQMGATACIAPLWKVTDSRAKEIAELFYEEALRGKGGNPPATLGEALRNIRARWKEKRSLTHLGYVLYGDPTTRLTWKPGRDDA